MARNPPPPAAGDAPSDEALEALAQQIPRQVGEPDGAYRALLLWASQPARERQWLAVIRWLGRTQGYTQQLKRWSLTWDWEGRAPLPDPAEEAQLAAETAEALAAKTQRKVQRQTKRALSQANAAAHEALTTAAKVETLRGEVAERLERLDHYEGKLRGLWDAQLRIGTALLSKLVPAVQGIDVGSLKPRDLAALLTATRGMVDSAVSNLSEAEGVTAFLDQARREIEETPPAPPPANDDQETVA